MIRAGVVDKTPELGIDVAYQPAVIDRRQFLAGHVVDPDVFNPATEMPISATDTRLIRDPFPGNKIPSNFLDPVALKIQSLVPNPSTGGLTNNFIPNYPSQRLTTIPAVKIDHSFSSKAKLAFYWSTTGTESALSNQYGQAEGFPDPITAARGTYARRRWADIATDA